MTLHTQSAPLIPQFLPPVLDMACRPTPGAALFGTLIVEVVLPDPGADDLHAAGWHLRLWPVARLGDATLEARPLCSGLGPDDLRRTLRGMGVTLLGPIRQRG